MPCVAFSLKGWKCMTFLMVLEAGMAIATSVLWGTGTTERVLATLVDPQRCYGFCLDAAHKSVGDIRLMAAITYGLCALFASVSLVGLLSGQVWLQVPNVVISLLKIVPTLWICENLLDIKLGDKLYTFNRVVMYGCTTWNIMVFIFNCLQARREYKREQLERSGRRPAEIRPLTNLLAPYFENCNLCNCGDEDFSQCEVNTNELRVPIHEDSTDGEQPQQGGKSPLRNSKIERDDLGVNSLPRVVKDCTPHKDEEKERSCVVDMGEENLSNIENLNASEHGEVKDLQDSKVSRNSNEMDSTKSSKKSGKRKDSRDESMSGESQDERRRDSFRDEGSQDERRRDRSRDDISQDKRRHDSSRDDISQDKRRRDSSRDDVSQDDEYRDEEPLVNVKR